MVNELTIPSANFGKSKVPSHMQRWLIKFAPFRTAWNDIVRTGTFTLRGVRSPEARRHLAAMRLGNPVLFYQSQQNQAIVGLLEVAREAYPDPTSADPYWLTCDFTPVRSLEPISLATLRADVRLSRLPLLCQPRLAVMPVTPDDWDVILPVKPR
jgi:predicted RNA-binding protein with PUA-like domain